MLLKNIIILCLFYCSVLTAADPTVLSTQGAVSVSPIIQARTQVLSEALLGRWRARFGDQSLLLTFQDNGNVLLGKNPGIWNFNADGKLVLQYVAAVDESAARDELVAVISNGQLSLSGAPLTQAQLFTRDPALGDVITGWMGMQLDSTSHRMWRLLAICIWIAAASFLIWLVRHVGRIVILSSWGPFRWVFPQSPLRAATILSLILNTCKYIIYGIGLGFVLSTFDVDYTTYLASLSVIGLAIGFGSQGLVQDMVTGIFILLERQFDVGDVVELSGQIGVVNEMGLRMTRLQTIQGQLITIPNRSISMVSCYGQQGLHVELSGRLPSSDNADRVAEIVSSVVEQFAEQFAAAVLATSACRIEESAEHVVMLRLDMTLWPGQQALIDQQLLPRLRTALPADAFPEVAITLAWHFDRPKVKKDLTKTIAQWFSRGKSTENGEKK